MVNTGLYIGYWLFIATVAAAVLLPLISALRSPKTLIQIGVAIAIFVALFLFAFAISSSEVTDEYIARGVSEQSSKLIGAGLIMFYTVFVLALAGIIFSQVNKILKR